MDLNHIIDQLTSVAERRSWQVKRQLSDSESPSVYLFCTSPPEVFVVRVSDHPKTHGLSKASMFFTLFGATRFEAKRFRFVNETLDKSILWFDRILDRAPTGYVIEQRDGFIGLRLPRARDVRAGKLLFAKRQFESLTGLNPVQSMTDSDILKRGGTNTLLYHPE